MTSREVVKKAITFSGPDRIPFDMPVSGPTDVFHLKPPGMMVKKNDQDTEVSVDRFGCKFEKINERTMGQPTDFPLKDIDQLDEYVFPDPLDPEIYSKIDADLQKAGDQYVNADIIWFTFIERIHFIHGFENTLIELYEKPNKLMELADKINEYNISVVKEIGRRYSDKVNAISMSDDWGTQSSTFISPALFKDFFYPRYKKLFDTIHDHGMDIWLHSCGYIMDFLPLFIDLGVQSINLQQPRIFDLRELEKFKGAICFNVPIDIQNTMPRASREEIKREAAELVEHLATEHGGIIASEHSDYEGNGIDLVKGKWAYEAFEEVDPFQKK